MSLPLKEIITSGLSELPCTGKSVSHLGLFLLPHFTLEIKTNQGTNSVFCGHNYLHLRTLLQVEKSQIFIKCHKSNLLLLQRKDCLKKEKKPTRTLYIRDNLKRNACFLQAVQGIFLSLLNGDNFQTVLRLLVVWWYVYRQVKVQDKVQTHMMDHHMTG